MADEQPYQAETLAVPRCPACGSELRDSLHENVRDWKYEVPGRWSLVRCGRCAAGYLDPQLADPSQGYPLSYCQHSPSVLPDVTGEHLPPYVRWVRTCLWSYLGYRLPPSGRGGPLLRLVGKLVSKAPLIGLRARLGFLAVPRHIPQGRLLEVGPGNGFFLSSMKQLGWDVEAVEPDPVSAENARALCACKIHPDWRFAEEGEPRFDAICMNHVLEHVAEPVQLMQRLLTLLRPSGTLLVVVPNLDSVNHRVFGRYCSHLEPPRHVVMYSPSSLRRLVESVGFQVCGMRTTSERDAVIRSRESLSFCGKLGRLRLVAHSMLSYVGGLCLSGSGEEIVAVCRPPDGREPPGDQA